MDCADTCTRRTGKATVLKAAPRPDPVRSRARWRAILRTAWNAQFQSPAADNPPPRSSQWTRRKRRCENTQRSEKPIRNYSARPLWRRFAGTTSASSPFGSARRIESSQSGFLHEMNSGVDLIERRLNVSDAAPAAGDGYPQHE